MSNKSQGQRLSSTKIGSLRDVSLSDSIFASFKNLELIEARNLIELANKASESLRFSQPCGAVFFIENKSGTFRLQLYPKICENWHELNRVIDYFYVEKKTENIVVVQNFSGVCRVTATLDTSWHVFKVVDSKSYTISFCDGTEQPTTKEYSRKSFRQAIMNHFSGKKKPDPIAC